VSVFDNAVVNLGFILAANVLKKREEIVFIEQSKSSTNLSKSALEILVKEKGVGGVKSILAEYDSFVSRMNYGAGESEQLEKGEESFALFLFYELIKSPNEYETPLGLSDDFLKTIKYYETVHKLAEEFYPAIDVKLKDLADSLDKSYKDDAFKVHDFSDDDGSLKVYLEEYILKDFDNVDDNTLRMLLVNLSIVVNRGDLQNIPCVSDGSLSVVVKNYLDVYKNGFSLGECEKKLIDVINQFKDSLSDADKATADLYFANALLKLEAGFSPSREHLSELYGFMSRVSKKSPAAKNVADAVFALRKNQIVEGYGEDNSVMISKKPERKNLVKKYEEMSGDDSIKSELCNAVLDLSVAVELINHGFVNKPLNARMREVTDFMLADLPFVDKDILGDKKFMSKLEGLRSVVDDIKTCFDSCNNREVLDLIDKVDRLPVMAKIAVNEGVRYRGSSGSSVSTEDCGAASPSHRVDLGHARSSSCSSVVGGGDQRGYADPAMFGRKS